MKASVITIGDEILIGQIVDTNSAWISAELDRLGLSVACKLSVGDDGTAIGEAVVRSMERFDVTIVTGGLGPTRDDITKNTLVRIFGSRLVWHEATASRVKEMLARRGIAFNELNRSQAMVPECCQVLPNLNGTAPGMWFEREGRVVVSLPGVPFEMKRIMTEEVLPRLAARFSLLPNTHKTMVTFGLAESLMAERIAPWEEALPAWLHLAYLPSPERLRLRLSAYGVDGAAARAEIDKRFGDLERLIAEYFVGYGDDAGVERVVHEELRRRGATLAVAESCTGGVIASRFTAMPGASDYFRCGVVSYSVAAKCSVLGVSEAAVERCGVVSESVVRQMAEGVRRISGADYAIATTGVAGPGGGTPQTPVGTVWIAVAGPGGTVAQVCEMGGDRGQVIGRAASHAIWMLRGVLLP